MAANLTTAEAILKEFYIAPIQEQLNQESFALTTFEKEAIDWSGDKAIIPLHIARNAGVGFRGQGQALPTATAQGYKRLEVDAKFMYGRFGFTGPALEFSDNEKGSFEPVMTGEMKRLVEDVRNLLDKAAFTGGEIIGLCWQQQDGATWQYSGRVDVNTDPVWGVQVGAGQNVTFIRTDRFDSAGILFPTRQVTSIDETTMVLAANVDTTGTPDGTIFAILHSNADRDVEMRGVLDNLGNPTLYGVDRTFAGDPDANAALKSNFLAADFAAAAPVQTDLTLDALQIVLDKILLSSNAQPDMMVMNPVHRQSYTTLLQGTAAGVPGALRVDVKDGKSKADGGFTSIGYADIPFKSAQNCPKGQVHFWSRRHWCIAQRRPGDFAQGDGKVLNKVPGFDAYEGYWKQYGNLVCRRPNAQGVLAGVSFFGV